MIKAIIFDFSGVVFTNGMKIGIDKIHAKYKLNKGDLEELLDGESSTLYRLSKISPKEFWQNIQDQLFLTDIEVEDVKKTWFDSYKLIPGMLEEVDKLRKKGLKAYYLSDNPEDRANFLEDKFGFKEHFDGGVFSYQAQFRKPSKEIFDYLLKDISLPKDQLLYLDDKKSNLDVAEELGLKTYHFINLEQFQTDLNSLLS